MADINLSDITGVPVTTYQDLSAPAAGDMFWSMATSRDGCYIANGADYAIADEPDLYAAIGTAFNTQINPTTGSAWAAPAAGRFRVPDMRAVVPRGAGAISTGGSLAVGEYQADQMQGHRHSPWGNMSRSSTVTGQRIASGGGSADDPGLTTGDMVTDTVNGTPRVGSETRVKSRGGNWFIRRFNATYVAIGTGVATADRAGLVSREQFGTYTVTTTGALATSVTFTVSKVGRTVTYTIPSITGTFSASAALVIPLTSLPDTVRALPGDLITIPIRCINNGTAQIGIVNIDRDSLAFFPNVTAGAWAATANAVRSISFSFNV